MEDLSFSNLYISVIVPVYNYNRRIGKLLKSLIDQNFNRNQYEIIIVDNGSTDGTVNTVKKWAVKVVLEHNYLCSPYSARNRGIERAKGNIIVLLDSSCIPKKNWLSNGIHCLENKKADIVGGNIVFRYYGKKTAGKIFDAITNVKMKESIIDRNVAKAGNLFIRREVFNNVGLFPEGIRSGGDVRWTRSATDAGFKLVYCKDASVWYPAKPLGKLIKKQWRVGLGQPSIWFEEGDKHYDLLLALKIFLKRLVFLSLIKSNKKGNPLINIFEVNELKKYRFRLLFIGFLINTIMLLANYFGLFKLRSTQRYLITKEK